MMRLLAFLPALLVAVPACGQTSIDSHGVRSGGVRIDATGIHSGNASVTRHGVVAGERNGGTTINGNGASRAVDCRGGTLSVNGNRNLITARECRAITVTGNGNQLRWHATKIRSAVTNVGNGNRIVRF